MPRRGGPRWLVRVPRYAYFAAIPARRGLGGFRFALSNERLGPSTPRARAIVRDSSKTWQNLSLARARGADSSAFYRFAYFADYPARRGRRGHGGPLDQDGEFEGKLELQAATHSRLLGLDGERNRNIRPTAEFVERGL